MEIKQINGDLLTSNADIICHQVNCMAKFNSGIAKEVRDKYPHVYEAYMGFVSDIGRDNLLGRVQFVRINDDEDRFIGNLFGQKYYGYDGAKYTSYDAVYKGLLNIKEYANLRSFNTIAFPYGMSSVRGGANWNIIYKMIEEVFKDTDLTIEIWKL